MWQFEWLLKVFESLAEVVLIKSNKKELAYSINPIYLEVFNSVFS